MARSVGLTRDQILAAAAELADEHGFEQFTLAQVAARLGVRLPSLYNHIEGLPALRRQLSILGLRQLGAQLARAALGRSGDQAVFAAAEAHRRFAVERPGLYAASVRAAPADDPEHRAAADEIVAVSAAILQPYGLDGPELIHAVRGMRAVIHGFASIETAGGFGLALDRDESFRRLLRTYVTGLRPPVK